MIARVIALCCFGCGFAAVVFFVSQRSQPDKSEIDWRETETGYAATSRARNDQVVCACGGYQCHDPISKVGIGTEIEPTHIGYSGRFRDGFVVIKDPAAGDDPDWGRVVTFEARCIQKQKGEPIMYELRKYNASVGTQTNQRLQLMIR